MTTEYALRNVTGDLLQLNDSSIANPAKRSMTLGGDEFEFENKVEENSALPGAVQLGTRRLKARQVTLTFVRAVGESQTDYKALENELLEFLQNTKYLVDVTNDRQVPVAVDTYSLGYDSGAYALSSNNEIVFTLLEPFWTDITKSTVTEASLIIGINEIAIATIGNVSVPPILTFTTAIAVTELQIYIDETKEGIQINDALFGTGSYLELIIDCINGTITLGTLNRINSVLPGTGYYTFPTGSSTLIIVPTAACGVTIDWYERYYI